MTSLVFVDFENDVAKKSALSAVAAAQQLGDVDVLVTGHQEHAQKAQKIHGVKKVRHIAGEAYQHDLAEPLSALIASVAKDYTHIFAAANTTGKDIIPRIAALLDVQPISGVVKIENADDFVRPIYAGNALETVRSSDKIKCITIRGTAFDPVSDQNGDATLEALEPVDYPHVSQFIALHQTQSARPDLEDARVVISGGRGMGSEEKFHILDPLADELGAAIGASRAAVDAGYAPNELQVGQTGRIVAPELYIAFGISGAIQHLAGMKDSKVIVAVNKDPEAPIFRVADYGLVADLFDVVPEMVKELKK